MGMVQSRRFPYRVQWCRDRGMNGCYSAAFSGFVEPVIQAHCHTSVCGSSVTYSPFFLFKCSLCHIYPIVLCAALSSVNPSGLSLLDAAHPPPGISERSLIPTQLVQLIKSLTSNKSGNSFSVLFLPPYLFISLALIPSELNHLSLAATFSLSLAFFHPFSPSVLFPLYFSQDFFHI